MESLVTIVVPVYNAEEYISRCIDSILKQSYHNIELLLINDGSTDDSENICRKYAREDNRIKIFSQPNSGVSSARNKGIDKALGDYIMFVDADDYIEECMVEVMYDAIKKNNASMSIAGMQTVKLDNEKYVSNKYEYKGYEKTILSRGEYLSALQLNWAPFCKLMSIELLSDVRYDEKQAMAEDLLFNAQVILANDEFEIAVCKEIVYNYVDVPTSATKSSYSAKCLHGLETEARAYEELKDIDVEKRLSKIIFSGVITFFYKYSMLGAADRKRYVADLKKANKIVRKYERYLLEKRERSLFDRIKMIGILYVPNIYMYIRSRGKK